MFNRRELIRNRLQTDTFSWVMGWIIWALLTAFSFLRLMTKDELGYWVIAAIVAFFMGYCGARLNVHRSKHIGNHEPLVQIVAVIIQFSLIVVPSVVTPSHSGELTLVKFIFLVIVSCGTVLLRILYSDIFIPLSIRLCYNR